MNAKHCEGNLIPDRVGGIMQVRWVAKTKAEARKRLKKHRGTYLKITMNPKLQASGRKGGQAKGPTKARPLPSERARNMALARWRKSGVSVNEAAQNARQGVQDAPGTILIDVG